MEASENIAKLRDAYLTWSDSHGAMIDVWLELFADDFSFKSIAFGADGGANIRQITDKPGLRGYFDQLHAEWHLIHCHVYNIVAEGENVIAQCSNRWQYRATGACCEVIQSYIWTFQGGKAVELVEQYDNRPVAEARIDPPP